MSSKSVPEEDADSGQTVRGVVGGTKLFNRFSLQKVLGRGGMGIVWLARDERLDRLVALKLVPDAVCFDASAQEELKQETRKSLMLTHPNIVRIFDFIEDERTAAISMEYVDGATLSSLRVQKPSKCFEVGEVAPWVTSLCDALAYAQESAHLIHRDLKPANLMVNSRLELKITDFGIACSLRESMSRISVHTSSGTLNYMSPQQMLGEDPSPSDDIYAVGATLYELLSSKPPFYSGDVASQVREVIAPTVTKRRAKFGIDGNSIPKHWEETIAACLAKNPEHRPRSPADIARRLRLGGTIRLTDVKPDKKARLVKLLADLRGRLRIDPRIAAFAGGVMTLIAAIILVSHQSKPSTPSVVKPVAKPAPAAGYAIEVPRRASSSSKTAVVPAPKVAVTPRLETAVVAPPHFTAASEHIPAPSSPSQNAKVQLTTAPVGANFAIYAGVIAGTTAPAAAPLRSGTAPDSVEDLPSGRYTLFFHSDGWPDDRAEISVDPGETLPVDYTFPHGTAIITSTPDGAEIFLGTHSLGHTPLTIDLPLGKRHLLARYSDLPERTQTVTIESDTPAKVLFQMRRTRSSGAKPTPTPPSALDKLGQSLKHVFGGKSPTPPPRRRH